jgi:Cdc6-like AAA superfamily ATPase
MDDKEYYQHLSDIGQAFTPGAPINSRDLFAGRTDQIKRVINTIFRRGQHVVLFGERGVGKTSLARTLFDILVFSGMSNYHIARVNCSDGMDFEAIWRSAFKEFVISDGEDSATLDEQLPQYPNPENIRQCLQMMNAPAIVIIDEFDRVEDTEVERLMADTIKTLSDNSIDVTLIIVGVANSVDQLIGEHPSTDRAIVQTNMPRMSKPELLEIVDKGMHRCEGLVMMPDVRTRLADFAHGLPTYTHLLARESATAAVEAHRTIITMDDLKTAIKEAVDSQLSSNLTAYNKAVATAKGLYFKPVLLACALAEKDEKGFFFANAVKTPLQAVTGEAWDIPAFAKHLKAFSEEGRGTILQRDGRRYRFEKPIMEPYVILRGLADGLISETQLTHRSEFANEPVQLSLQLRPADPDLISPLLPPHEDDPSSSS